MKLHENMKLILGPPGTGKTTKLLDIMEKELANGIRPDRIAFISFTRKAAYEARDRAIEKFGFEEGELKWFRTLHSLAYGCMGLSRSDVFSFQHAIEFGKKIGEYIILSKTQIDSDAPEVVSSGGYSNGSIMMFIDNLSRMRCEPLRDTWEQIAEERFKFEKMKWFSESYKNYKKSMGLYDFTDMILDWKKTGHKPKLDVVILDEVQDFTRSQWVMIEELVKVARKVYAAGDDDQSIYEWSGADLKTFLSLQPKVIEVLDYSYRLPRQIWELANGITKKISQRNEKQWGHREEDGNVSFVKDLDEVPLNEGNWLALTRNRAWFSFYEEYFMQMGYSYGSPGYSPIYSEALKAVKLWERLRKGGQVTVKEAKIIYSWMTQDVQYNKKYKNFPNINNNDLVSLSDLKENFGLLTEDIWRITLDKISDEEREYFVSLLRRGESVSKPRININTIHSVKGGECDNVILISDMSGKTFQAYEENPDPEHRVFYVGVTRAKQNLWILFNQSETYYEF